jgi:hypothetical protein
MLLLTACESGGTTSGAATPSPSPRPSLAASPLDEDPCATPNTIVTRRPPWGGQPLESDRVSSLGSFVGDWHVHGEQMVLRANGTGFVESFTPDYSEKDIVQVTRYRNPDRAVMRVVEVRYSDPSKKMPLPAPADDCSLAVGLVQPGDTSVLHFVEPHVLREVVAVSHLAPDEIKGDNANPYWSSEGASPARRADCN